MSILKGTVYDAGGKPVPGVRVKAAQLNSGKHQEAVTNESGSYIFKNLSPGKYRLEAKYDGFEIVVQETTVGDQIARLDFTLRQSVNGAASNPPSAASQQASSPESRAPRSPRRRGFQSLTLQTPESLDASQDHLADNPSAQRVSESAPAIDSGVSPSSETLVIQGSTNASSLNGSMGLEPTEDQMQERRERIRQRFGQGDFGGARGPGDGWGGGFGGRGGFGGGSRGGGRFANDRLRGNFFESYRNSVLDARPFSFSGLEQKKEPYIQNNFGVFIGGPLNIPKMYHGADRTSFFIGYQGSRLRNPYDNTVTVPTLAERNGDFSQTFGRFGNSAQPIPVYDPAFLEGGSMLRQFPNNVIPIERISPIARSLLSFIPLPNLPGTVLNYHLEESLASDSDMLLLRLNHRLSPRDNLSFYYSLQRRGSETGQVFPGFHTDQDTQGQNLMLGLTHNFTSHVISDTRFRFNRLRLNSLNQFAFIRDVEGELGISGVSPDPLNYGVPSIRFTNYATLQDTYPALRRNQTSHLSDTVTFIRSNHTFRSGFEYRRIELNNRSDPNGRGTFTFSGFATSAFDSGGRPIPGTGYDLADFLLGLPQSTAIRFGDDNTYFRGNVFNLFFMDNWRVAPQLTLNLGLRYELASPLTEKFDRISNLDIAPNFAGAAVVLPGAEGPYSGLFPAALIDPDRNNLAPRIGLAWKPFPQQNLVVRSGYGIFYNASIYNQFATQLASQPPFAVSDNLITRPDRVLTLANGFPSDPQFTVFNSYAVDRHLRVGYVQQWNLDIQQQLRPNLVLTVSYNGSKGTRLDLLRSPNRAPAGSPLETDSNRIISNAQGFLYETSGAASIFHSLQIRLQRRFTSGLSVNASYIFGKSIDNASSIGGGQETVALIDNNLRAERGLSTFDMRHQLTINHVYEFPFGERKRFLSHGGLPARLLGGWSLSGMTTLQSGSPYTARILGNSINNSGTGANQSERADATGLPVELPESLQTVAHFFNTDAFTLPTPGRFGYAGRNTITGPGTTNFNMALAKVIRFSPDGKRLEFRTHATNVFNTPNFNGLGVIVDASNYGHLISAKQMRQFEFTLRFNF